MSPESVADASSGPGPALQEVTLTLGGRDYTVLHGGAVFSEQQEQEYLSEDREKQVHGLVLWPSAVALAHELSARARLLRGRTVLELGAGTGLPGIVAAAIGAHVVQTDRQEAAMAVCRRNAERNAIGSITHRVADWARFDDASRYDLIIGSDIVYAEAGHPHLRRIFDANLAPGGRLLIADPFRPISMRMLATMEADGWTVRVSKWTIGEGEDARAVGVFDLARAR